MKIRQVCFCMAVSLATWATADLPLRHVTLFDSGVGHFERSGAVDGDVEERLRFRTDQINDVLKSLVVIDEDRGAVRAVTYDARDPLERTLKSFAVDLSDHPTLADLLVRLRGAPVRVKVSARDYEGRVVGVERHTRKEEDTTITVHVLNLHTEQGLRPVRLEDIQELEIVDPALAQEFQSALAVLAEQKDQARKEVRLRLAGEGKRRVRVAYLLETPVWKTSYRLVINDEAVLLQGWAYVENMTDNDWESVSVSLVSGRPISFIQNLYDPIYVQRPEISAKRPAEVKPQEHARDVSSPLVMRGLYAGRAEAQSTAAAQPAFDVSDFAGQEAGAVGEETGELFQYVIAEPVTIPRQSSAMLPIVQKTVEGKTLSIYNESVHANHPLNGIELNNTSDAYLMRGPVTVFEEGIYAGDARMPDTRQGERRLLSYALDLGMEVSVERAAGPQEIVSMKIVRGMLLAQREHRDRATYKIRNLRDRDRLLLIEHPYAPGWDLLTPEEEPEHTREYYRFRVPLEAGETTSFVVTKRQIQEQTVGLRSAEANRVEFYLSQTQAITSEIKDALRELVERQEAIAELTKRHADTERSIAEITKEQERIRKNMAVVQRPSDSFAMWERKLIEQEEELAALKRTLGDIRSEEAAKTEALNEWLAKLSIE